MLHTFVLGALVATAACGAAPPSAPAQDTARDEGSPASRPESNSTAATADRGETEETGETLVRMRIVADTTAFVPGEERLVGVNLLIEEGWHVYAQARNDSGSPVEVTLELPAGYGPPAVPLQPMPRRHVAPGNLLDHVYEREVTLPLRVTVPGDTQPGSSATFTARAEWFVCRDICLRGAGEATLAVPIVASPAQRRLSADEPLLREAEARLPRPLPAQDAPVALALHGDALDVRAPGASGLTFVPDAQCVALPQLLEDGERAGDSLSLRLDPDREPGAILAGALEVRREPQPSAIFRIQVPVPARSPP